MRVNIRLQEAANEHNFAWLVMDVVPSPGERFTARLDVAAAVTTDATSFLHPPAGLAEKAIRDEVMVGLLRARKVSKTDFHAELMELGGSVGATTDPTKVRSIAYGVAAFLAAAHAVGFHDLKADPIGGHGWRLAAFSAQ